MTRRRKLVLGIIGVLILAVAGYYVYRNCYTPPAWTALRQWAQAAEPGALLKGNPELAKLDGRDLPVVHTQDAPMRFVFSDSPEYLYRDALGKGLATMRLTDAPADRATPGKRIPFGVGIYHINKVTDPETHAGRPATVSLVVRAMASVTDAGKTYRNTRPTVVRLLRGACGVSDVMPMHAGKACAISWFTTPNVQPATVILRPGEAKIIYARTLQPDECMSAMLDLDATNGFFLRADTVFGVVKDFDNITYAPYGMTIGTNSGTGPYWKRILRPVDGTPPFDAADTRHINKAHLRYVKQPPQVQYLDDETWDMRPENQGKKLVRSKGGRKRPFKGDYNVEYTIVIPVVSKSGKPASFAVVDVQRFGMFGGAIRTADGHLVQIPAGGPTTSIRTGAEGVLLTRGTVTSKTPVEFRFNWLLPGGSYGDQAFMLIPLGD